MKKLLALLLALVMVFTLCACGKDSADGTKPDAATQPSTEAKDNPTEGNKADGTEPPVNDTTAPAATDPAPTTPAPTNPAPTGCAHDNWKAATCTAPKTCSNCGYSEGSALGHSFADGSCTKCGADDNRVPFSDHVWELDIINGAQLTRLSLDCYKGTGSIFASLWSETATEGDAMQLNGKTYYPAGYGGDSNIFYVEGDNTVTITVDNAETATQGTLTLTRANATQYTVTAVSGTIINDTVTGVLKVGSVFTVFILNIA